MKRTNKIVEQIKQEAKKESKLKKKHITTLCISTGSTLLNLAMTDCKDKGYPIGKVHNVIGDSSAGKSIQAISVFSEACLDSRFDKYDLIYDDAEQANEFDIEYLFGKGVKKRIKAPYYENKEPINSETIEDFWLYFDNAIQKGKPFIYVLDSLDALTAVQDQKKAKQMLDDVRKKKIGKGSMGMAKPKKMSELLRELTTAIKETKSLLIIVSQTRDNVTPLSFEKNTRAGGRALKFYCCNESWVALAGTITKTAKDQLRQIGVKTKTKVTKNKYTGKCRQIQFPIYYDYGIDDLTSCIEWLLSCKVWTKSGSKIKAKQFDVELPLVKLIQHIEHNDLEDELTDIVEETWNEIEEALKTNRKRKY